MSRKLQQRRPQHCRSILLGLVGKRKEEECNRTAREGPLLAEGVQNGCGTQYGIAGEAV